MANDVLGEGAPVDSILDLIGRTPMVRIRRLNPSPDVALFAKPAATPGSERTVASEIGRGTIVTIFPDRGEKYLSTELFHV